MRKRNVPVLVLIGCLAMPVVSASAEPMTTKQSQSRAFQALRAALEAVGVPHMMQSGGSMVFKLSGEVRDHTQGHAPGTSHSPKRITTTATADLHRNWLEVQTRREFLSGSVLDIRFVLKPEGGFSLNQYSNDYAVIDPPALRAWDFLYLFVPALVLKQAAGNPGSLRWLGEEGKGAGKRHKLSFSWHSALYTLTLGAESHLLHGLVSCV